MVEDYVPELDITAKLQAAMADARVNVRSYQFTSEKAYLEKGRATLVLEKTAFKEAEDLAGRTTKLVKLKEQVKFASGLLSSYEQLLTETEKASDQLDAGHANTLKVATDATGNFDDLLARQNASLEKEMKDKAEPEKVAERLTKIMAFNKARGALTAMRISINCNQPSSV
jgi:hypothetical protein